MGLKLRALSTAFAVLTAGMVLAAAPPRVAAQAATGTISGFVRSPDFGPVAAAEILLDGHPEPAATTDESGVFIIADVAEGPHTLIARSTNFSDSREQPVEVVAGNDTFVELGLDWRRTDARITVTDMVGNPLRDLNVSFSVDQGYGASTDANGVASFIGVPVTITEVAVSDPAHFYETAGATVAFTAGGVTEATVTLSENLPLVTALVVSPTGEPVPGVTVHGTWPLTSGQTRYDGRIAFTSTTSEPQEPMLVTLTADATDPRFESNGPSVEHLLEPGVVPELTLTLVAAAGIDGLVLAPDGQPLAGAAVRIWNTLKFPSIVARARTGTDGTFAAGPLSPGEYIVELQPGGVDLAHEWYPDEARRSAAQRIFVGANERVQISAQIEPWARIRGHVYGPDNVPVSDFDSFVTAIPAGSSPDDGFNSVSCRYVTDSPGSYGLECLRPNTAYVLKAGYGAWEPSFYPNSQSYANATPVITSTAELTGIDFHLQPARPELKITGTNAGVLVSGTTTRISVYGSSFPTDPAALSLRIPWFLEWDVEFTPVELVSDTEMLVDVTVSGDVGPTVRGYRDLWGSRSGGHESGCGDCPIYFRNPETPEVGTITGFVLEYGFSPVPGAVVTLEGTDIAPAITAEDGSFTFTGVPMTLGTPYRMTTNASGYLPNSTDVSVIGGGTTGPLVVGLDPVLATVRLSFVDTGGQPVSGVRCTAGEFGPTGQADSSGICEIPNLETGAYTISTYDPSGVYGSKSIGLELSRGVVTEAVVVFEPITQGLLGTVRDSAGVPIAGLQISTEFGMLAATTNAHGRFGFEAPPGGKEFESYDPTGTFVTWRDYIVLSDGLTTVDVTLARLPTLRGTVVSALGEPTDAEISVYRADGTSVGGGYASGGTFDFALHSVGPVVVFVRPSDSGAGLDEYYPAAADLERGEVIELTDGGVHELAVALEPPSSITGRVVAPDGSPGAAEVAALEDRAGAPDRPGGSVTTGPDGEFTIDHLRAGSYALRVTSLGSGSSEWHADALSAEQATPISVGLNEQVAGIVVQLDERAPIVMTGISHDFFRTGSTTTDVRIYGENFPSDPDAFEVQVECCDPSVTVHVDRVLSDGELSVTVTVGEGLTGGTALRRGLWISGSVLNSTVCLCTIFVGDAESLIGTVSGTVTDSRARPLGGIRVSLKTAGGWGHGTAVTAADGTWTVRDLQRGSYLVTFHGTEQLAGEYWEATTRRSQATEVVLAAGTQADGRVIVSGVDARLVRRGAVPSLSSVAPAVVSQYRSLDLVLRGENLSPIVSGFDVTVESADGVVMRRQAEPNSNSTLTVKDFYFVGATGTYDVVLHWANSVGSVSTSRCRACLTVLPYLYAFAQEELRIPVGGSLTTTLDAGGLIDLKRLSTSATGVSVVSWRVVDENHLEVTLRANRWAIPGPGRLTVLRTDGATAEVLFEVVPG